MQHISTPRARAHGPLLAIVASGLLLALPARADVTTTDLQVAARALSFVSNPLSGTVQLGIVYSSNSPNSLRQAKNLRTMLGRGMKVGALELRPVLIESADAANANVDLLFLTEHMAPHAASRRPADGSRQQILCVTTDIEQVRNGGCILGIQSRPKVEVFVNRVAAAANDITFSTVFRVMITEL